MRKAMALAVGLLLCLAAVSLSFAEGRRWKTNLDGFREVPAVSTMGFGQFTASTVEDELQFELRYDALSGTPMMAHIHFGRARTNGGVIAFLCGGGNQDACPASPGVVSGTIGADDVIGPLGQGIAPGEFEELVRAMKYGATYINVHTDVHQSGEIRGEVGRGFSDRVARPTLGRR